MRADWIRLIIAAARLPLRSDPANNQFDRPSAHGRIKFSIWLLSVDWHSTIFQVARQRYPAFKAVIQGFGRGRTLGYRPLLTEEAITGERPCWPIAASGRAPERRMAQFIS